MNVEIGDKVWLLDNGRIRRGTVTSRCAFLNLGFWIEARETQWFRYPDQVYRTRLQARRSAAVQLLAGP